MKLADAKMRAKSAFEARKSENPPAGFVIDFDINTSEEVSAAADSTVTKSGSNTVTLNGKIVSLEHEHN